MKTDIETGNLEGKIQRQVQTMNHWIGNICGIGLPVHQWLV